MNANHQDNNNECINNAILAYQQGDRFNARKWSMQAILKNPGLDSGWILLAAVSPPEHGLDFAGCSFTSGTRN